MEKVIGHSSRSVRLLYAWLDVVVVKKIIEIGMANIFSVFFFKVEFPLVKAKGFSLITTNSGLTRVCACVYVCVCVCVCVCNKQNIIFAEHLIA